MPCANRTHVPILLQLTVCSSFSTPALSAQHACIIILIAWRLHACQMTTRVNNPCSLLSMILEDSDCFWHASLFCKQQNSLSTAPL